MTQPQLIGRDEDFNRDVFLTILDQLNVEFEKPRAVGQFACLCVLDGRSTDDSSVRQFCRKLIRLGCAYLCCWGPDCERIHDLMDGEVLGDNPPESYIGCLMTTWHAKESLEEAIDFFLTCTCPNEDYAPTGCDWGLAIVVGSDRWKSEVNKLLAAKLYKVGNRED